MAEHGGAGTKYVYEGCRCDKCREANAARHRRLKGREPPQHGTESAYNSYGCRCGPCKAAGARKNARQYQKRKRLGK